MLERTHIILDKFKVQFTYKENDIMPITVEK